MPDLSLSADGVPSQILAGSNLGSPPARSAAATDPMLGIKDSEIVSFVTEQRKRLQTQRREKRAIWDECWELYRQEGDFRDKEEWQSQIVLPKAYASVKQGVGALKRLLQMADQPWTIDAVNPDDTISALRGQQIGDIVRYFLFKEQNMIALAEGLEVGFVMGHGIWRLWWAMDARERLAAVRGPDGRAQMVIEEIREGNLRVRAVDPYNFYWLPGSRFNRWTGTIEDMEIPAYELLDLGDQGVIDPVAAQRAVDNAKRIEEDQGRGALRFAEPRKPQGASVGMRMLKLTEYFGPVLDDRGHMIEPRGHMLIANDDTLLLKQRRPLMTQRLPYVGWSPLLTPLRTEGIGLIEPNRRLLKAFNKLVNMSMDGQVFRLMPLFETIPEVYENPEELDTGIVPGKILKRGLEFVGTPGITPIPAEDISQGAIQLEGILDRSHQEGSFITELLQALPRFRGAQTATEIDAKSLQQSSFLESLAQDTDQFAIQPLVELAMDIVIPNLDTTGDPRVASILGVGAAHLRGMSQAEILEIVQGDYVVHAQGLTTQVRKAQTLDSLVQFMNLIGQNVEVFGPFVRQDQLLQRILEAFRPHIRDIENILADPATVEAQRRSMQNQKLQPELLALIPGLIQSFAQLERDQAAARGAQAPTRANAPREGGT